MPDVDLNIVAHDFFSDVFQGIKDELLQMSGADAIAVGAIAGVGGVIALEMRNAFNATVDYNKSVQEMMNITGQAPDASARILALFKDFGISASDAKTSARILAKEGLQLDIDTLHQLSDEFQAIHDPAAQQEFLLKNLGRAGFDYAQMLGMSKTNLDALYQSMDAGLAPTKAQMDATFKYGVEVNHLDQHWLALKITFGQEVIPELARLLEMVNENWGALKSFGEFAGALINPFHLLSLGIDELVQSLKAIPPEPPWLAGGIPAPGGGYMGDSGWNAYNYNSPTTSSTGSSPWETHAEGGWVGAMVGEKGPEKVMLPRGSYVHDARETAGMLSGGGGAITFVYSPMFSMGDRQEAEMVIAPVIEQVIRRMRVDGRV